MPLGGEIRIKLSPLLLTTTTTTTRKGREKSSFQFQFAFQLGMTKAKVHPPHNLKPISCNLLSRERSRVQLRRGDRGEKGGGELEAVRAP